MKKSILLFGLLFLAGILNAKVITKTYYVYFDSDAYQIKNTESNDLNKLLTELKDNSDYEIFVKGHTDSDGNLSYNEKLSERRANSVKVFLNQKGAIDKNIRLEYFGERKPERKNIDEDNKQKNRRVEIILRKYEFENIAELQDILNAQNTTVAVINPQQSKLLVGESGVKIYLEPNSFTYPDGTIVTEKVELKLTEAVKMSQFINEGLSCVSDGNMLESGGMFKLDAKTISGKDIMLDNAYTVQVPSNQRAEGMELFTSPDGQNWIPEKQSLAIEPWPASPNYERCRTKGFPTYYPDSANMPRRPFVYGEPHKPFVPVKSNFKASIPWYKAFSKAKIESRQENAFENRVARYEEQLLDYEKRYVRYENSVKLYPQRKKKYDADLIVWHQEMEQARKDFYNSEEYIQVKNLNNQLCEEVHQNNSKLRAEYKKEIQAHKQKKLEQLEKLGITDYAFARSYVFTASTMDWINCDRFVNVPQIAKVNFKATNAGEEKVMGMLVFEEMNSVARMYKNAKTGDMQFGGFPTTKKCKLLAMKVVAGKIMLCKKDVTGKSSTKLNFEPGTVAEIREMLSGFDA